MNPLTGASFYDSLIRFSIGLMLIVLFFGLHDLSWPKFDFIGTTFLPDVLFIIACYVIGLFFSLIVDKMAECLSNDINRIFCKRLLFFKNDIRRINKYLAPLKKRYESLEGENDLETYWFAYYNVEKAGLLGNVRALELISAFLMNLGAVTLAYVICFCVIFLLKIAKIAEIQYTTDIYNWTGFTISFIIIIFCCFFRDYVEDRIYNSIISAYKFLLINDPHINNNTISHSTTRKDNTKTKKKSILKK